MEISSELRAAIREELEALRPKLRLDFQDLVQELQGSSPALLQASAVTDPVPLQTSRTASQVEQAKRHEKVDATTAKQHWTLSSKRSCTASEKYSQIFHETGLREHKRHGSSPHQGRLQESPQLALAAPPSGEPAAMKDLKEAMDLPGQVQEAETRSVSEQSDDSKHAWVSMRKARTSAQTGVFERGFAAAKTADLAEASKSPWQRSLVLFLNSWRFELLMLALILLNALFIGLVVDHDLRKVQRKMQRDIRSSTNTTSTSSEEIEGFRQALEAMGAALDNTEIAFLVIFSVELLLRLYAFRRQFFFGDGWAWNWFDFILVAIQVGESIMYGVSGNTSNANVVRLVRCLRGLRVVGIVRLMKHAPDLRLLMTCLMSSAKSFFWAMTLLLFISYVMGILVCQAVSEAITHDVPQSMGATSEDLDSLLFRFGNVPRSLLSLLQGVTGGCDWGDLSEPLIAAVSPYAAIILAIYICFSILSVLNIVTAIFVDSAVENAQDMKQIQMITKAKTLFDSIDIDTSGRISFSEIQESMNEPAVGAYFREMDVDIEECECLFELLDADGTGEISLDEFVFGCIRMQQPLKVLDLVLVARELQSKFGKILENQLAMRENQDRILENWTSVQTGKKALWT